MNQRSKIRLRGCREHNLRGLDLEFDSGSLTVLVGPSGSGKRSLLFGTLHAESQRRFLQSCSLSERSRLESLTTPELDSAVNLILTQAIRDDSLSTGPRNTVGTETGLLARLQHLFAVHALPRCPECDLLVRKWSIEEIERELTDFPGGLRMMLGFQFTESLPLAEAISWLNQAGFSRGIIGGSIISFDQAKLSELTSNSASGLIVIVDRLKTGDSGQSRIRESLETCLRAGRGHCVVLIQSNENPSPIQSVQIVDDYTWIRSDYFRDLTCPRCSRSFPSPIFDLFRFTTSLGACPECHGRGACRSSTTKKSSICPACEGTRWGELPRLYEWNGRRLPDYCRMSIRELFELFSESDNSSNLGSESLSLFTQLIRMNLGALPLDLSSKRLSGSECRRIAIARACALSCIGRMFLLDDPFEGASHDEYPAILDAIAELIARGGTVCAICDHPGLLSRADKIIQLGPGSGERGGTIVYSGPPDGWRDQSSDEPTDTRQNAGSLQTDPALVTSDWIWPWTTSKKCSISLGRLNVLAGSCTTRPIGFVREVLVPLLLSSVESPTGHVTGHEHVREIFFLTAAQRSISPRQLVISAVKALGGVRELLALTEEARKRNFTAGYFSLHKAEGGRCPQCLGVGRIDVELDFLPELPMTCPACHGRRFRETVDAVRFRGLSIVEILNLSVDEGFRFFRGHPAIQKKLQRLRRVHLGYLKLGQPLSQLSRGERRRVELASALAQTRKSGSLLILEETSIGLSQSEVTELGEVLREYVVSGNTILSVDHHPRMLETADVALSLEECG